MTWNKIQVATYFYAEIHKHNKLFFLKPIRAASTKANIGQFFIIFNYTGRILQLYKGYTAYFINIELLTPFKISLHYLPSKNDNEYTANIKNNAYEILFMTKQC